uniref:Probable neurotoxin pcD-996 n=1 Tax=Androctonus australis TaxID=6858 RepID=SCXD_ANDAU|nr:RecName: Full=Probable neurotoxin pcD-996; Flags: Precursor [Androctonus australis]CAC37324.1 putative toxin [Androctonus australis]
MNYLVMISFALLLVIGVESVRDGYFVEPDNCLVYCMPSPEICDRGCKRYGATSGFCKEFSKGENFCWCKGLR